MQIQDYTFLTPGFSVKDLSHRNTCTIPMGKVVPVEIKEVNPGEVVELDFSWFCRTFPMGAPLLDTMEVTFDAFWLPKRVLSHSGGKSISFDFEEFHNPLNLQSGTELPAYPLREYVYYYLSHYGRLSGTLYDFLGYPCFPKAIQEIWRRLLMSKVRVTDPDDSEEYEYYSFSEPLFDVDPRWMRNYFLRNTINVYNISSEEVNGSAKIDSSVDADYFDLDQDFSLSANQILPFTAYVYLRWKGKASVERTQMVGDIALYYRGEHAVPMFDYICNELQTSSVKLYDDWKAYVLKKIFSYYNAANSAWFSIISDILPTSDLGNNFGRRVSVVPFIMYRKIINDWYVNPLLVDGDSCYLDEGEMLATEMSFEDAVVSSDGKDLSDFQSRLWEFDRFVSCTPAADQPNVLLPANPSVKDIRNANRVQLMLERVMKSGKRYVDQILTTFGIKPSDARVDRSEVLFRRTALLDMQTVFQTNQAELSRSLNQPLGSFAGNSMSFQAFNGGTFQFDEHGFFVIMASIRPKSTYFQGLNKFLLKLTADQFLIPDFAQIGDDEVMSSEIYYDYNQLSSTSVFGYQQRYYEYSDALNEIHGHMIDELRYFHLGRYFDSEQVLDETFTTVNVENDDLSRIWSTYDEQPFMLFLDFREKWLRPLPEHSMYIL